jgi:hypothetical protein
MMHQRRHGCLKISISFEKKVLAKGFTKSDTICSTVGWLEEASQTLEYGKNYEGYCLGELFVKQVFILPGLIGCPFLLLIIFVRSKIKLSWPLRRPMELVIRLSLWLTTHRVIQHTLNMHW